MSAVFGCDGGQHDPETPTHVPDSSDSFSTMAVRVASRVTGNSAKIWPCCSIQLGPASCYVATTGPPTSRLSEEIAFDARNGRSLELALDDRLCKVEGAFAEVIQQKNALNAGALHIDASSKKSTIDDSRPPTGQPVLEANDRLQASLSNVAGESPTKGFHKYAAFDVSGSFGSFSSFTWSSAIDASRAVVSHGSAAALARLSDPKFAQETLPRIYEAARDAEIMKAHRALRDLENHYGDDASELLENHVYDQITRVGSLFEKFILEANTDELWTDLESSSKSTSSHSASSTKYTYSNSTMKVMITRRIEVSSRIDMFKVFAGLCEYDLSCSYLGLGTVNSSQRLWPKRLGAVPSDSLWRVVRQPDSGGREDNIYHVSFVDALKDEAFGALLFAVYTPDHHTLEPGAENQSISELFGQQLPQAQDYAQRIGDERTIFTIRPLKDRSFEVKQFMVTRLTKAAHLFPGNVKNYLKSGWEKFLEFIQSDDLSARINFSEQSELYEHIQAHVAQNDRRMLVTGWRSSLRALSANIPKDWADFDEDNDFPADDREISMLEATSTLLRLHTYDSHY